MLYHLGPDFELGNTSVGSTASVGFNNLIMAQNASLTVF